MSRTVKNTVKKYLSKKKKKYIVVEKSILSNISDNYLINSSTFKKYLK